MFSFEDHCEFDVLDVVCDMFVFNIQAFEISENLTSLVDITVGYEPARRFWKPRDSAE